MAGSTGSCAFLLSNSVARADGGRRRSSLCMADLQSSFYQFIRAPFDPADFVRLSEARCPLNSKMEEAWLTILSQSSKSYVMTVLYIGPSPFLYLALNCLLRSACFGSLDLAGPAQKNTSGLEVASSDKDFAVYFNSRHARKKGSDSLP